MKIGDRVITPGGRGRVEEIRYRCGRIRYGVRLETWNQYQLQNGLTYYYAEELKPL